MIKLLLPAIRSVSRNQEMQKAQIRARRNTAGPGLNQKSPSRQDGKSESRSFRPWGIPQKEWWWGKPLVVVEKMDHPSEGGRRALFHSACGPRFSWIFLETNFGLKSVPSASR